MRRFLPQAFVILIALIIAALLPAPSTVASAGAGDIARQTGLRLLGATRGYATTTLWLRAGDAYRRGDYYETLAAYQLIAELQPRNPAVYSFLSWNQAYNISAPFPDHEQRLQWVLRGLSTLHLGQDRMPTEASLRLDEWQFLLDRTIQYPVGLLDAEVDRLGKEDPQWAQLGRVVVQAIGELPDEERRSLNEFLRNVGFHFWVYSEGLEDWQIAMVAELEKLSPQAREKLEIVHWCRLQAMLLALRPALKMQPRSLTVDIAVVLTCHLAWQAVQAPVLVRLGAHESRGTEYREGVASAVRAGIENARRRGGSEAVAEFLAQVRENLSDVPELASGLTELNE